MKYRFIIILIFINSVYFITNEDMNNTNIYNYLPKELLKQLNIIDKYKDFAFGAQLGANDP